MAPSVPGRDPGECTWSFLIPVFEAVDSFTQRPAGPPNFSSVGMTLSLTCPTRGHSKQSRIHLLNSSALMSNCDISANFR
jgi:hypothetical protein